MQRNIVLLCVLIFGLLSAQCRSEDMPSSEDVRRNGEPLVNRIGKVLPIDAAPLEEQILRHMLPEPRTLDVSINNYDAAGSLTLYDPLLKMNTSHELIPAAAARWGVSDDGLVWTFHMRADGRWSDGRSVTAHDFEYTFRRLLNPDTGNPYAFFYYDIKGAQAYNTGVDPEENNLSVRAIDDLTLEIETTVPRAYLPYITAFHGASPAPRWAVEKHGVKWTDPGNSVSNGSYRLTEWTPGVRMVLSLDPQYNGPNKGSVEHIHWIFNPINAPTGMIAYENNEIDYVGINVADLVRVQQDPILGNELVRFPLKQTAYLYFQHQSPPFSDVRLRRAFAHAIDRDALTSVVLGGSAKPAYAMLPPDFPGYAGEKHHIYQAYDPPLARRLMTEAGYPDGRGFSDLPMWIQPGRILPNTAVAVQGMLKEVLGINIEVVQMDGPTYRSRMYDWEVPLGFGNFGPDFPDPHSNLGAFWRSGPRGVARHTWHHAGFDDLVDRAARSMDTDERLQLYDEAQRLLVDDVGGVFLYYSNAAELRKPWLKGVPETKYGTYPFPYLTEVYIGDGADRQIGR
jgi:oligopeptide transport system substrate-binding protein